MNCLHNYIVNDTPSFLSQPDRIETVFEMCKHVNNFTKRRKRLYSNYFSLGNRQ
jgi:hypothetical protein